MRALYRRLLSTLPRELRERHGREMELLFDEGLRARRGPASKLAYALGSFVDVARAHWMLARARPVPSRDRAGRVALLEPLLADARLGVRALVARWRFGLLAIVTLGLGIGAVTAVFSVVEGVLLRPLPYRAPERIVILWHDLGNGAQSLPAVNQLDYLDYKERGALFDGWTLATGRERLLGEGDAVETVDVGLVSESFFPFFGVRMLYGRGFLPDEDAPGGPAVAVLSHRLFVRRFGADPGVVGRTVRLGGEDHAIVGVLPPSFRLLLPPEAFLLKDAGIYRPAQIDAATAPPRNYTGYTVFGRLAPGVSDEAAQQEIDRIAAELRQEHAELSAASLRARIVPLHQDVVKAAARGLRFLMAAVACVLLITCANLAQLLLARFRAGERELALRAALGASRFRLVRFVLTECLLVSAAGGVLGVLLARLGLAVLPRVAAESLPRLDAIAIDGRVLGFGLALSLVAALAFGLLPALSLSGGNLASTLAESSRASRSRGKVRLGTALIVAEVALSFVLLVGAGLSIRSFVAVVEADAGFQPRGLLTARLSLPAKAFSEPGRRRAFLESLRERLSSLPGVVSVAATSQLPLTGSGRLQPYAYDAETSRNWESVTADEREVTEGFFQAMGATLLEGRELTEDDARSGRTVIVIDDTLAERAFPGESAVGRTLQVEPNGSELPHAEIVGVVAHLKLHDVSRAALPQIYFPLVAPNTFNVVVRTEIDPEALAPGLRESVRALATGIGVEDLQPMSAIVETARSGARLSLALMMGFGAFAMLLAGIGLFGVLSHAVGLRRIEIGIRMALGASPGSIRRRVLAEGLGLVVFGTAAGLAIAAGLGRLMAGALVGVEPLDALTYVGVATALALVSLAACWIPARRATRVDPIAALRSD